MSAIRVARAATGRTMIVKFDGCYHGHADPMLVAAGSGVATLGLPDSPGVPTGVAAATAVLPFNDLAAVEALLRARGDDIAAVIVEPVAGNMGVVPPGEGFLAGLRAATAAAGTLLIFDEVMTGWRVDRRGAQQRYAVTPDLTCLGKVIGGGVPAAAFGGRRALMERVAPTGPVYQGGTLSGNPLAMAAGLATLDVLARDDGWERAADWAERAALAITEQARHAGVPVTVQRVGTMFTPFFTSERVVDYASARRASATRYAAFFHAMLAHGVYLPPSPFEAAFTSTVHGDEALAHFVAALAPAMDAAARIP